MSFAITLPDKPTDGYSIEYFNIEYDFLQHIRLIYRERSTWHDVCPNDNRPGADFINEWQVFENGRFTARIDGWETPSQTIRDINNNYFDRAEAVKALKARFEKRSKSHLRQALECLQKADEMAQLLLG